MTSYQKLKARINELEIKNKQLNNEIRHLVLYPNGIKALNTKNAVILNEKTNNQLLLGCGESKSIGIFNVESK